MIHGRWMVPSFTGSKEIGQLLAKPKISVLGGNFYADPRFMKRCSRRDSLTCPRTSISSQGVGPWRGFPAKMSDLGGFPPVLSRSQISPQTWQLVWIHQPAAATHSTRTLEHRYAGTFVPWYTVTQVPWSSETRVHWCSTLVHQCTVRWQRVQIQLEHYW